MPAFLRDLFCGTSHVSRSTYFRLGVILMLVKYGVDAVVYMLVVGGWWNPFDYLNPIYALRMSGAPDANELPPGYIVFLVLWGLAFAWFGVGLSSRRATDAGGSPWWGLLFFVPGFNYLLIVVLLCLPTRLSATPTPPADKEPPREEFPPIPRDVPAAHRPVGADRWAIPAMSGVFLMIVIAAVLLLATAAGHVNYGLTGFLSVPIAYGVGMGVCLNLRERASIGTNLTFALVSSLVASSALLLLGAEGLICVAMALPITTVSVSIGVLLGRTLVLLGKPGRTAPMCLVLAIPSSAWLDAALPKLPAREVASQIVIDAPPEVVWQHVVSFSELPEPDDWWFHTGLAYPQRARIEGSGVGAVRYCEFSTGAFVEPITVWDEPRRLGFDVVEQPLPMEELSFYDDVSPPHLETTFRSVRGEFRLTALEDGRTRLEGSTWYELDMAPAAYWRLWGDAVIHRIHVRVLEHVRALSEADAGS